MPTIKLAHLRHQNQNMIIVPLAREFGLKARSEQSSIIEELEFRANRAGLAGTVVAIWQDATGQTSFIAPKPWHGFFKSVNYQWAWAQVNFQLNW